MPKSTPDEIRERFDRDVDRFSNLETGQGATVDAPLVLDLITATAAATNPGARAVLDLGCGAGNYAIKLIRRLPGLDVTLVDLSRPMLDRAAERLAAEPAGAVAAIQGDIREVELGSGRFDIILAAAVLHHLRGDAEWEAVFRKLYVSLRPGGSLWVSDLVAHADPAVQAEAWRRYGEYLAGLRDEGYRDQVFAYIEREDSPRPVLDQVDAMRAAGFAPVEILHKNLCFAAFVGFRRGG